MVYYKVKSFPRSRIATNDICTLGVRKHHIAALLEIDVTEIRKKLRGYKEESRNISFTAWLLRVICVTVMEQRDVAAFMAGKQKVMVFENINVSLLIEKDIEGEKVPIPLMIENANERSAAEIGDLINVAKNIKLSAREIVLHKKTGKLAGLYYLLPGGLRRFFWKYLLRHPRMAIGKMGNVAITSVGMLGKVNGWFIPISVHPLCFGIGGILKKALVIDDEIVIREVLNMTVLLDHDVVDGGLMTRFVKRLTENIENAIE
jgi:pyruvate/2-oxoglutarate dehydrogenase complex dihydrolipoamide acyltransferase (E2) component